MQTRPQSPTPAPRPPDETRVEDVIPVIEERLDVSSRVETAGAVRVRVEVERGAQTVRAHNVVHTVAVRRVPRGTPVQEARAPWNEGDTLVVPVYEERLVLERRLVLKEEIHIVRQTVRQPVERQMPVRTEHAVVERQQPDGSWAPMPVDAPSAPSDTNAGAAREPNHPERTDP